MYPKPTPPRAQSDCLVSRKRFLFPKDETGMGWDGMAPSIASPSREEEFQWAGNAVRPSGFRYSFSCLSAFPHNESPRRLVILLSEEISPALNSHFPTQLCQSSQRPIRIVMIFIQCACAARTMIKCSNGSDMCPKRHVVNGQLVGRGGGGRPPSVPPFNLF